MKSPIAGGPLRGLRQTDVTEFTNMGGDVLPWSVWVVVQVVDVVPGRHLHAHIQSHLGKRSVRTNYLK